MDDKFDIDHAYRRYGPMVFRRCLQLLKDDDVAADALQDVFVQVARNRGSLRATAPSALLNRIATNVCLNRLRAARRRPGVEDDSVLSRIAATEDLDARTTARSFLQRLFGTEPASTQTLAILHLVDGLTLEEVAKEVGLSPSGVRKRLRTLRARLPELEAL